MRSAPEVTSPTLSEWSARLPPALTRILPNARWTSEQSLDAAAHTISWKSVSGVDTSGEAVFSADGPGACTFTLTIRYTVQPAPVGTCPAALKQGDALVFAMDSRSLRLPLLVL